MRSIVALSILVCACTLVGCKGKEGVVGEWQGTQPGLINGPLAVTAKFDANGNYSFVMGSGQITSELDGTYTYDDSAKQITLNQKKMLIAGQEVKITSGNPAGPGRPVQVTWKGSDEMTISMLAGNVDLKRK